MSSDEQKMGDPEAASPISSRPPAANNFEELMRVADAGGGGPSSSSGGNRWPRQETLALLQVRSEMDAAFRDATLKAPLWDQISRKLGELGYTRSGKKCKEKFENVQKYYKRTKESRGGRQDGKSYKFFNQLEALHHTTSTSTSTIPVSSSVQLLPMNTGNNPNPTSHVVASIIPEPSLYGPHIGISFSSSSSSSSDDEIEEQTEMGSFDRHKRKRKRRSGDDDDDDDDDDMRMMDFFEGLMKEVMQRQEAMQQKLLEAIDKREQDRMIREEAWKRQDMARLARQQDLMAQDRAGSAARDAAIVAFLQKITGESIHLPTHAPSVPVSVHQHQREMPQSVEIVEAEWQQNKSTDRDQIVTGIPEQQQIVPLQDFTSLDITPSSSRWPKTEVLALIQVRSGLDSKYQEAGPKGPLWEEISAVMMRMGYNRSAKRCKEKWENINKYFKKVKESNKKRPEDAKTCPYFHELDELYRKKLLGNTSTSSSNVVVGTSSGILGSLSEQQDVGISLPLQSLNVVNESEDKDITAFSSSLVGEQSHDDTTTGEAKQPEDMLKKQHQQCLGSIIDELDLENDEEEDDYEENENDEEMKMAYKIQLQRQNVSSSGSNGASSASFMAMVK